MNPQEREQLRTLINLKKRHALTEREPKNGREWVVDAQRPTTSARSVSACVPDGLAATPAVGCEPTGNPGLSSGTQNLGEKAVTASQPTETWEAPTRGARTCTTRVEVAVGGSIPPAQDSLNTFQRWARDEHRLYLGETFTPRRRHLIDRCIYCGTRCLGRACRKHRDLVQIETEAQ